MTKPQDKTPAVPMNEDDVLRRMLATPPKQHEATSAKKKPAPKPQKK
jgi:hypothetical protein